MKKLFSRFSAHREEEDEQQMIASRVARKSVTELPPIDLSKIADEDNEMLTSPDSSAESSVRSNSTLTPKLDSPLDSPARRGRLAIKSRAKKSPSSEEQQAALVITNRVPVDAAEISRYQQVSFFYLHIHHSVSLSPEIFKHPLSGCTMMLIKSRTSLQG